jgi:hypothetical protein
VKGKNRAEATMKLLASEGEAPGLRSRREISEPLDSPDPEAFDDDSGPVGKRIGALFGPKKLRTLFEIQTHRNTFGLILEGSEVGAVALDETNIPLENDAEPTHVRRVEIEVEPDAVLRLEPFVERLRYACRLSPASASKYEAGLFARGLAPPGRPEFGPTGVHDSLTAGELAFRVLREQFAVFLAHEPGVAHRYEVQARELRAEFPEAYSRVRGKRWKKVRRTMEKGRPREETR